MDDKIVLHFTRVLDQTKLRLDDEYELGERSATGVIETDRAWWEHRSKPALLSICDEIAQIVQELTGEPHRLRYKKKLIDVISERDETRRVWCQPKKTLVHIAGYVSQPETWVKRFEDAGLSGSLRRGNKAACTTVTADEFSDHKSIIRDFLRDALASEEAE